MLFQLHWQRHNEPSDTILVTQFAAYGQRAFNAKLKRLIAEHRSECPENYMAMLCTEESEHFRKDERTRLV